MCVCVVCVCVCVCCVCVCVCVHVYKQEIKDNKLKDKNTTEGYRNTFLSALLCDKVTLE